MAVIHWSKYSCRRGNDFNSNSSPTRTTKQNEVTCKHCLKIIEYRKIIHHIKNIRTVTTTCGIATRRSDRHSPNHYRLAVNQNRITCPRCITKLGLDVMPDIGTLREASQSFALGQDKQGWYLNIKLYISGEEMQVVGDDIMTRHSKYLLPPPPSPRPIQELIEKQKQRKKEELKNESKTENR